MLRRPQIGMYRLLRNNPSTTDHTKRVIHFPDLQGGRAPAPVNVGMLSVAVVLNGYSYFIAKLHEHIGIQPLVSRGPCQLQCQLLFSHSRSGCVGGGGAQRLQLLHRQAARANWHPAAGEPGPLSATMSTIIQLQ